MLRPFSCFFFLNQLKGVGIHRALKAQNDTLDGQIEPSCILLWGCPVWQWLGNSLPGHLEALVGWLPTPSSCRSEQQGLAMSQSDQWRH